MTNNDQAKTREVLPVAALLWITSISTIPMTAPRQFGGRRWDEQLDNVSAWATRVGITLTTDDDLFIAHVSGDDAADERLGKLLEFVNQHPTKRLFVPGSVFADLNPAARATHINTMVVYGTELIICSE